MQALLMEMISSVSIADMASKAVQVFSWTLPALTVSTIIGGILGRAAHRRPWLAGAAIPTFSGLTYLAWTTRPSLLVGVLPTDVVASAIGWYLPLLVFPAAAATVAWRIRRRGRRVS